MKTWLTLAIPFVFACVSATASPAAPTADETRASIIHMEKAALERWTHGDPSGFLAISAADVVYFDPAIAHRLDGLPALTAYYKPMTGKIHADKFELIDPKVTVISKAAVLTFNFVSWYEGKDDRWNCTEVYRQTPDGWRIIQTHWSPTQPKQK